MDVQHLAENIFSMPGLKMMGGVVASCLVHSSPNPAVLVRVHCVVFMHGVYCTLTVLLSSKVYKFWARDDPGID